MKTIVITGGNRGIGLALARKFGSEGFRVVLLSRKRSTGELAVETLVNEGIDAHFFKVDVALDEEIVKAAQVVSEQFGGIDILVNNAGMMHEEEGWIGNTTLTVSEKALTKTFVTNFIGPWKIAKAFVPLMENREGAQILNISAKIASLTYGADKRSQTYNSKPFAYNASKGALNQLTVHLAHALRRQKIRVLSIYPGWVQTDMGGEKATFTPLEAANRIFEVIHNAEFGSGTFIDYDHELPW